ncbi:hypothetical protein H632_c86p2 [Helicosporidium sp. ATCC 50920]|nr:hypothetical protein H632_c86p2 [Helicosporidium sp. ATCC 50920]|eukprot:KDD76853.1 hypothetical protein H632_c86p2 [Helicosporidium sp. ATCC 50920]
MLPSPMPSHSWLLALPSRRAVLSVPADSLRKVQKAAQLGSRLDTVCLDLEDAVAEEQKEAARRSAFDALAGPLAVSFGRSERALRVNGPESTHFEADMALAARLHRQGALDCLVVPKIEFKDLDALKEDALKGRGLGMSGKHIIHPAQIDPVQEAFSPDPQLVAGARKIVRDFEEQRGEGAKGAIEVDGKMIDRPTYLQAKQLVHLANELGL